MIILPYDEERLVEELEQLPHPLRATFAAACAERLLPAYISFSERSGRGDGKELVLTLERLWCDLKGDLMTLIEIEDRIRLCEQTIPSEDDEPRIEEQAAAEDASAAVIYALRCRKTGESQEAAWAARRAYEAVDNTVVNRERINLNEPGAEYRVLSHPVLQAELARQRRDLDELLRTDAEGMLGVIAQVQERSRAEAPLFFGSLK